MGRKGSYLLYGPEEEIWWNYISQQDTKYAISFNVSTYIY